ncbi:MAG: hypothetical protein WA446_01790 [Steroidobacteraceae bacterium]
MRYAVRPTSVLGRCTRQPPAVAVPVVDLERQYQAIAAEIAPILENICVYQQLILDRYVMEFESAGAFMRQLRACRHLRRR